MRWSYITVVLFCVVSVALAMSTRAGATPPQPGTDAVAIDETISHSNVYPSHDLAVAAT